jgi:hypothetical protein
MALYIVSLGLCHFAPVPRAALSLEFAAPLLLFSREQRPPTHCRYNTSNGQPTPRVHLVMSLRWYNGTRRCIRLFYQQGNSFIQLMRDTLTAMDAWMHLDGDDDGDRNTAHRTYLMANGRLSDRRADQ